MSHERETENEVICRVTTMGPYDRFLRIHNLKTDMVVMIVWDLEKLEAVMVWVPEYECPCGQVNPLTGLTCPAFMLICEDDGKSVGVVRVLPSEGFAEPDQISQATALGMAMGAKVEKWREVESQVEKPSDTTIH